MQRKIKFLLLILVGSICIIITSHLLFYDRYDYRSLSSFDYHLVTNEISSPCHQPNLEVWNPSILKHIKQVQRLKCQTNNGQEDENWIIFNNDWIEINDSIIRKYDPSEINCMVTYMNRIDDYRSIRGERVTLTSSLNSNNKRVRLNDDFFWVD